MRSYPIYHKITACNYKSSKSFGSVDTSETEVLVGTGRSVSEPLVRHVTTKRVEGDYTVFRFGVDLHDGKGLTILKTMKMHTKSRVFVDTGETNDTATTAPTGAK